MKLFTEPGMEKVSYVLFMEKESTQWVRQIISHFLEEFPFLQNQQMTVTWKKKDANKGYAVGAIQVLGAQVPVIIKEWNMFPLDVIIFPGTGVFPLTQDVLTQLMTNPIPFKGIDLAQAKSNLSMFGDLDNLQHSPVNSYESPDGTTSEVRDAVKVSSFIDKIENIDSEAVQEIFREIASDNSIKVAFEENDTVEILNKLAEKDLMNVESSAESFIRGLDVDRQYIYKDEFGNFHVKQANSAVDHVWDVKITANEAEELNTKLAKNVTEPVKQDVSIANAYEIIDKDDKLYINKEGNWHIFDKDVIKTANNFEIEGKQPEIGDKGVWLLENKVSMPFEVVSLYKSAEFEDANIYSIVGRDSTLYINADKNWLLSNNLEKTANSLNIEGVEPEIGDFGVFVLDDEVTPPFDVTHTQKVAGIGNYVVRGINGLEKVAYFPLIGRFKGFTAHESVKNGYYVPGNAKFVKLSKNLEKTGETKRFIDKKTSSVSEPGVVCIEAFDGFKKLSYYLTRKEGENIEKRAGLDSFYVPSNAKFVKLGESVNIAFDAVPVVALYNHKVHRDSAGLYNLSGPQFDKYAKSNKIRDLSIDEVNWAMIHCNSTIEDLGKVAKLKYNMSVSVDSDVKAPNQVSDICNLITEFHSDSVEKIAKLTKSFVKEASVLTDKATVDAVLSLGLLRKHNIAEYLTLIPSYEMVMSELARLLLVSRLGLTSLPENIVERAMDSVTEVVTLLKRVEASTKKVK